MILEKLTKEQKKQIHIVRDSWYELFESKRQCTAEEIKPYIKKIYKDVGYKEPLVTVWDSPVSAYLGGEGIRYLLKNSGVGDNIGDNIWENIRDNIRANIWDNIRANIRDNIRDNISDNIGDNIWDNIGVNIWDNISYYINTGDWGWISFRDYFDRIGILEKIVKKDIYLQYKNLVQLLRTGVYESFCYEGLYCASRMPISLYRLDNRLHNINGNAVEWADGFGMKFVRGVYFKDDLFNEVFKHDEVQLAGFKKIENQEQKMAALSVVGVEGLQKIISSIKLKSVTEDIKTLDDNAKVVRKSMEFILYESKKYGRYVIYSCPSTDRKYYKFTEKKLDDPVLIVAEAFSMTKDEYLNTIQT